MSFIITWVSLGLIGWVISLFYEWYTGKDINLKDFVLLFLFFLVGPVGLFVVVIVIVAEILQKFENKPLIKGRKQ